MKRLLLALVVLFTVVGPATAARPTRCEPAIAVAPEPSTVGEVASIRATCLPARHHITFSIGGGFVTAFTTSGEISLSWPYFQTPGSVRVAVYDAERRFVLLAETDHLVVP